MLELDKKYLLFIKICINILFIIIIIVVVEVVEYTIQPETATLAQQILWVWKSSICLSNKRQTEEKSYLSW